MLRCPVVRQVRIVILLFFFKACSQSLSLCSFPCFKVMKEQWSFASPPPSDCHLVKRRCFYLRQEQCLTDYVISRNYMQICHRYKSAAVRGLTFLFVTSKHSSVACLILLFRPTDKCPPFKRTNPRSSVFTFFFPHHCSDVYMSPVWSCSWNQCYFNSFKVLLSSLLYKH